MRLRAICHTAATRTGARSPSGSGGSHGRNAIASCRRAVGGYLMTDVVNRFDAALYGIHEEARKRGYRATRFVQMLDRYGGVETAKRLLAAPTPQSGFATLWEMGEPELTVEW